MSKPVLVQIQNQRGLHARASAKLVKCAEAFDAEVTVSCNGRQADALSIMDLMMLGAHRGSTLSLNGHGTELNEAIHAIQTLIEKKFGEEQ